MTDETPTSATKDLANDNSRRPIPVPAGGFRTNEDEASLLSLNRASERARRTSP